MSLKICFVIMYSWSCYSTTGGCYMTDSSTTACFWVSTGKEMLIKVKFNNQYIKINTRNKNERKNRSVMEMVRAMLHEKGFPNKQKLSIRQSICSTEFGL